MKILNIIADRNLAGVEDIEVGSGHIEQTRLNKTNTYHKINIQVNLGLLCDCNFKELDSSYNLIRFTGFYNEGDGGEGFYEKVAIEAEHDIGVYITNKDGIVWKRKYTHFVSPSWFGAVGDGETNDATALLAALKYGEVDFDAKHYVIDIIENVDIPINRNLDLIGNNSIIEIKSILGDNKLNFIFSDNVIKVKFRYLKFITKLDKLFYFTNTDNIVFDIDFLNTYEPNSSKPLVNPLKYLTIGSAEIVKLNTFTKPLRSNILPTNDLHPVIKKAVKPQELPPDAVTLDGNEVLVGPLVFTKPISGVAAVSNTGLVPLSQLQDTFKVTNEIKTEIDEWLKTQKVIGQANVLGPGSFYIQYPNTKNPKELFNNSDWIRVNPDDVDTFFKVMPIPSNNSLNGEISEDYKDLDINTYVKAIDVTPIR